MIDTGALDRVLAAAGQVVVTDGGSRNGQPLSDRVLVTEQRPEHLAALRAALAVAPGEPFRCRCLGTTTLAFADRYRRRLAVVALHHGVSLRWTGWDSDALLTDGDAVLGWLDAHGAPGPLVQRLAAQRRAERSRQIDADWLAAMPPELSDLGRAALACSQTGRIPEELVIRVAERMSLSYPDERDRAAALLHWYGSGSGQLTGYPVHEELPGEVLAGVRPSTVYEILADPDASERQLFGGARYVLRRGRPGTALSAAVPASLRAKLLDRVRASADPGSIARAERVFT